MPSATQQIGNYRLLKHLGDGGQASVYLGEHLFLKRSSAIKILKTSLSEQESAAFLTEAQILANLAHPHIIRVHDYTIEQGTPFLVMDYAPGGTLRSLSAPGQPLPLDLLLTYLQQIASALQYAHEHGVIHRDIKPENLLLDDQQQIKLSDFGLALLAPSPAQLQTQELIGTVFYMAPEQLRGKPCFATDQYALGIVLYEWLCGELPFTGSTAHIIGQHLAAEMPSLREKRPDLPPQVEVVLRRALAKDPERRFTNIQEFAQAFEHACYADLLASSPSQAGQAPAPALPDPYATFAIAPEAAQVSGQRLQQQHIFAPPRQPGKRSNRQRMLAKVRSFWIDGVLEQSLRDIEHLVLGLREEPAAVMHPWELILQQADAARHLIPVGTSIVEVYDKLGGELLILGQPGSGKTTLLLELARSLLERAEQGQLDRLPVVFNLSSWAEKRRPLKEWLSDELNHKYQVPRKLARAWIEQDEILPLLDGLDEVAAEAQSACVEAVNTYHQDHGLLPLVICCRTNDYFAQKKRMQLGSSVEIQPLTPQQVDRYLSTLGQHLGPVRAALIHDQELQELLSTPLMLNVMALAYQDQSVTDLLQADTPGLRQERLFATYIKHMLERRGGRAAYTPEQTTRWLSWLAKNMRQHDQTVFYVERLQADWLPTRRLQRLYRRWAVRLPAILMGGLTGAWIGGLFVLGRLSTGNGGFLVLSQTTWESCLLGLFLGLLFTRRPKESRRSIGWGEHLRDGLLLGVCGMLPQILFIGGMLLLGSAIRIDWFALGPIWGLGVLGYGLVGFLCSLLIRRSQAGDGQAREGRWSIGRFWRQLTRLGYVRNGLICGLAGLIYGFVSMLGYGNLFGSDPSGASNFGYVFAQMLSFCTSFGIVGLLASIFIQRAGTEEIQPTEKVTWSWKSLLGSFLNLKHAGYAVLIGLFYGSLYGILGLVFGVQSADFWRASVVSVLGIVALVSWLLTALFSGWSTGMLDERKLAMPNEGMRRSALYGLLFGLLSWLVYGGVTWLVRFLASFTPLTQFILPDTWLRSWFLYGLPGALAIGLFAGGWACLKHAVLRRQLRRSAAIPRRYPHFLDYAAERVLLRKVGGGYLFIHRLLLDYFASLGDDEPEDEVDVQRLSEDEKNW